MALRARKVSGAFEKRAPAPRGVSPGTPVFRSPQTPTSDLV